MANNQLLASDNFASGSLAAGWSLINGDTAVCAITAGAPYYAEPAAINNSYGQLWTGLIWPTDQISEATIQTLNATGVINQLILAVRFRFNGAYNQGYLAAINHGASQANLLVYVNAGAGAGIVQLGSTVTGLTISSGDVWSLAANGAVITVYQNGTRVFYIGDATIASGGSPGFQLSSTSAVTNAQVASWRGYSGVQQDGIWTKQGVIFPATAAELATGGLFGTGVSPLQGLLYEGNAKILSGTVYKSWYTDAVMNGVGYSESADGITWTKYSGNPVISGYANGIVNKIGNTYYHWAQKTTEIGSGPCYLTTSSDGINWGAEVLTDLPHSLGGIYLDLAVIDVIGGLIYAVFASLNGTGSAPNTFLCSSANGINWTVLNSGNPVIANVFGLVECVKIGTTYYLWCCACQPGQGNPTAPGFDPLEGVLYSSTQANVVAGGTWTFVHHSIHRSGLWESLNSTEAGVYTTAVLYMPNLNRVGMFYEGSPGDSTGPQVYQGGLALAPVGSTLAQVVATNEDGTTQVAVDAFTSGTGPLSANWTTPTWSIGALQIVAGPAVEANTTSGSRCDAFYTGASFSRYQYSEVTIGALVGANGAQFIDLLLCGTINGSQQAYYAQIPSPAATLTTGVLFQIIKIVAGVQTTLSQAVTTANQITPQVGDVFRFAVTPGSDGSNILTVYQNGFQVLMAQDYAASLTSGFPGFQINNTLAAADAKVTLWAGGNAGLLLSPNVVGLTQAQATTAITGEGLVVGTITFANSSTVPAGDVISSSPAAGTLLAPGSTVNLVISLGPASGYITGNVVLSGALVECVSDHFDSSKTQIFTTLSDSSGNYSFSNLPVGRYYIGAWASGFVYRLQVLVVVDGVNANTDINLTPSAVNSWNGN